MRCVKAFALAVGVVVFIALIVPLVIPVPPLEGTLPPQALADPDGRFMEVAGLEVHYKAAGQGEPLILLLHGFGANEQSWAQTMQALAEWGTAVAYDRPAFGLTERPMPGDWSGANPYSLEQQAEMLFALMDQLGADDAIVVGHSAGGRLAVKAALEHPERVRALVLTSPAVATGGGVPDWLRSLLRLPQARRVGLLLTRRLMSRSDQVLRMTWHAPETIDGAILRGYQRVTRVEDWDRALWEFTLASQELALDDETLGRLAMPTLVITGDDDRIVPTDDSVRLAGQLPNAELVVLDACGHVPQQECPEAYLRAVTAFLAGLE